MFLWFLLSSTYCTLNTNILINWHVAFEYLVGIKARIRVQMRKYFSHDFYCLLPFMIVYKSPRAAIQSSSLVNLIMSICLQNLFFIAGAINFATFCNGLCRILHLQPLDDCPEWRAIIVNHEDVCLEIFQIMKNKNCECMILRHGASYWESRMIHFIICLK